MHEQRLTKQAPLRSRFNGSDRAWVLGLVVMAMLLTLTPMAGAQLFGGRAQGPSFAIENVRIITMTGRVIENGTIVLRGGRVAALGTEVDIPDRTMKIDGEGMTVTPGLIDVSSGLAISTEGELNTGALRRAIDGWNAYEDLSFDAALRNGVTSVYVGPPMRAGGFAGTGAVVRLAKRDGGGMGEVLDDRVDFVIDLSRAGNAIERARAFEGVRAQFRAALNYRDSLDEYDEKLETYTEELEKFIEEYEKKKAEEEAKDGEDEKEDAAPEGRGRRGNNSRGNDGDKDEPKAPTKPKKPDANRSFDLLLEVLDGELPLRVRAEKDADIENAMDLARGFGIDIVIEGGGEAWLVSEALSEMETPVILGSTRGSALRTSANDIRRHPDTFDALTSSDVRVLVGSGTAVAGTSLGARFVLENAQLATQGLDSSDRGSRALQVVTVDAARFLGIQGRAGQLFRGAPADVVLWDGDPTKGGASVSRVFVGGRPAFAAPRRN